MATISTIRNFVDERIHDKLELKTFPKYILMDFDNYARFRDELRALNLIEPPDIYSASKIKYRGLTVFIVLDAENLIEVVG